MTDGALPPKVLNQELLNRGLVKKTYVDRTDSRMRLQRSAGESTIMMSSPVRENGI